MTCRRPSSANVARRRLLTLAAAVLAASCTPAPRWIAVAGSEAVTLLDGELRPVGRLSPPAAATAILFAPDGASLFLATSSQPGATLLARPPRTGGVLGGGTLEGDTRRLRLTPDGTLLLAALGGAQAGLALVGAQGLRVQHTAVPCDARDVVLSASADRAYVICAEGRVAEVDPDLRLVVKTVDLPVEHSRCGPAGAGISANGTVLFVACAASGVLQYLDRLTLAPFDSVRIPVGATRLVTALGGRRALLVLPNEGSVLVVDIPGRTVRGRVPAAAVSDLAVAADGRRVFALASTRVIVFDAADGRVLRTVPLAEEASLIAVWPGPQEPRMRWDAGAPAPSPPALQPPQARGRKRIDGRAAPQHDLRVRRAKAQPGRVEPDL